MTGEQLKRILYTAGISQTELAEKLGTTQQNLYGSRWGLIVIFLKKQRERNNNTMVV